MANYLLLRNNKESGPYSLDDLVCLGLKAYDLVWVQGKSAAWRYPSELAELKPYAPETEEQPFDRFFKKPGDAKKKEIAREKNDETVTPVLHSSPAEPMVLEKTTDIAPEHEKYIPRKSVHVTLPGQKAVSSTPIAQPKPSPTPPVEQVISVTGNSSTPEVKYSQPLDEIKEMYVQTLQDRKQRIARKSLLVKTLKKAAVIAGLIASGLIAGFLINSKGNKKGGLTEQKSAVTGPQQKSPETLQVVDDSSRQLMLLKAPSGGFVNDEIMQEEPAREAQKELLDNNSSVNANAGLVQKERSALTSAVVPRQSETTDTKRASNKPKAVVPARGLEIDPATGQRNRSTRTEEDERNADAANDVNTVKSASKAPGEGKTVASGELAGLVSVSSNAYKKVAFGGIRNLELTITNESKYVLDDVVVELQYLKPNELPLKTENIEFVSVGPRATSTIRIPDTNRGVKISYKIIRIKSRQLDEDIAGK